MKRKNRSEAIKAADIVEALSGVTKEKSISIDMVLDSLKDALATAAKKSLNKPINVEAKIDREKGTIEVYTRQVVVEVVKDPESEILLDEARGIDPEMGIGDEVVEDLDINVFGRSAISMAKQVILQRIREAERTKIFDDFGERVGELITGTVQQIDKGNILVNLGRTEALLPWREQIRKERYRQGDTLRACIAEVRNNAKGPQVIISRTSPEFLARLFELEVPEIFDKTVKIVKVVRDPGHRSKIAVSTTDPRVDPVGACVGMRGNRVQAIVRELSNERIDIINWTEELSLLVRRVFSPAEVKRVSVVGDTKIIVIIGEQDLAQAIGKEGQNIRLASRMLDKEIDVYGDEEFSTLSEEDREAILAGRATGIDSGASAVPAQADKSADDTVSMDEEGSEEPVIVATETDDSEDAPEAPVQQVVEEAVQEITESDLDVNQAMRS